MPGKVFISCGQHYPEEKIVAAELKRWFKSKDFVAYVAIHSQSIQDVNTSIISELKTSDYYIFIDFPREFLTDPRDTASGKQKYRRGSLFTHQEMAIAYILGFEKVLFFRHKDVKLEGLLQYVASNAIVFSSSQDLVEKVQKAVTERNWLPTYTRHLSATKPHWSNNVLNYTSHATGEQLVGRFLYIQIHNHRSDIAAFNTVARLSSINEGLIPIKDRSHLKASGQPSYQQTIWPESYGVFDLLFVGLDGSIYLNSSLDLIPKPPIITQPGKYKLTYEVLSESFPLLQFSIQLDVTGNLSTTSANLLKSIET